MQPRDGPRAEPSAGAAKSGALSIAAHTILLIGVFFTADIFRRTRKRSLSYDELFKDPTDGGARYDDIWGAPPRDVRANA